MIPGEMQIRPGDIELNVGRPTRTIAVANTGDRPIQVGSHYHFYEANPALDFDREQVKGWRLNLAAGTAVRFEPGQTRTVELVPFGGGHTIYGFRGEVMGHVDLTDAYAGSTIDTPIDKSTGNSKGGQN